MIEIGAKIGGRAPKPPASSQIAFTAKRNFLGGRAAGAGGKGGGGGGIEAPNSLQSKAIVGIIDLLSEGPIGGLVNGAQSIYFNNVPLKNSAGGYNFLGVTYNLMFGMPDQPAIPGFPSVSDTNQVGEQILHMAPVTYVVTNLNVTRVSVIIEIPALFVTDTKNGNTNPTSVEITIAYQPADGVRTQVVDDVITGKCDSTYERGYTFPISGTGPWAIIVTRVTPDSTLNTLQNETYLSAVDEIIDHQISYSNSAYNALTFDSQYFGSTIPTRTYDIQGLLVQIPANYDPVARTYATTGPGTSGGTWDGVTMVSAITDNPAWVVYDVISNNRYGLGLPASALASSKWDLYNIGQYCDGMVPDGYGGQEPRYTCNVCLTNRQDAYTVVQSLVAIWRGMSYWGSGTLRFTADMPGPTVQLVTNADVVDGNFVYEGTALNARHTTAMVNYTDPQNYWQPTPIIYQDPDLLVQSVIGANQIVVNALGATTAGQALRQAKWIIEAEDACTDTVTYTAGVDQIMCRPGDIIAIADRAYAGARMGGRILAAAQVTVDGSPGYALKLDSAVEPQNGVTYALSIVLIDGTVAQDITIVSWSQNTDGTTTISIAAQEAAIEPGAIWVIVASNLAPRLFRVIGITQPHRGQYAVSALLHDPNLYEQVEYGIQLPSNPFSVLPVQPSDPLGVPSNISINDYWIGEGTTTVLRTTVSWTDPSDARVTSYNISVASDQNYGANFSNIAGPSYDIDNLPAGANYTFGVQSVTNAGATSAWAYSEPVLLNGSTPTIVAPTGLTATGGNSQITLAWQPVSLFNLNCYNIQRAQVVDGVTGEFTLLSQSNSTTYTDTDSTDLQPGTTWAYEVAAVDTQGNVGTYAGPVSATVTTITTGQITPGAVSTQNTSVTSVNLQGTGNTNFQTVATFSVAVTSDRTGVLLFDAQQGQSAPYTSGSWGFKVSLNGTQIWARTTGGYLDFPSFAIPISLVAADANNFVIEWAADTNVLLGSVTTVVLCTAV